MKIYNTCVLLVLCLFASAAQSAPPSVISEEVAARFAQYDAQSPYTIDHTSYSQFLNAVVYDVGMSPRRPAPPRSGGVYTGTRLSSGSRTRYRYEGNRVFFHLFTDDTRRYLTHYREVLVASVNKVGYSSLSRDEQLAFWLDLHNALLIEEIAKRHPIRTPEQVRLPEQGNVGLFDAKLVTVDGVELSLNDIHYGIVYRYWKNPDVIHGFWEGMIGGPSIPTGAYTGKNLWPALGAVGTRYVNSLRGVEKRPGGLGVSRIYEQARAELFPNWPDDLYAHLRGHAREDVAELLASPPRRPKIIPYDRAVADLSSGETIKFSGMDNPAAILSLEVNEPGVSVDSNLLLNYSTPVTSDSTRGGLGADQRKFTTRVDETRKRREGDVTIEDVDTDDPDESADQGASQGDAGEEKSGEDEKAEEGAEAQQ